MTLAPDDPVRTVPTADLHALAAARRVATEYWDWRGQHVTVSAETLRAVLTALGLDVSTPAAVAAALADEQLRSWRQVIPPSTVLRAGTTAEVIVHIPNGRAVTVTAELEDGTVCTLRQLENWTDARDVDGVSIGEASFEVPELAVGWHRIHAKVAGCAPVTGSLIVTPRRLAQTDGAAPGWGVMHQVYAMRGESSWGLGDLADLAEITEWAAGRGADFMLVNPMHASGPKTPIEASPYRPATRRFASPLYLRPELIDEYADLSPADRETVASLAQQAIELNSADDIDRDASWRLKEPALRTIFSAGRSTKRQSDFDAYVMSEGSGLTDFAIWCAIAAQYGDNWRQWPEGLHSPGTPAVEGFARAHAGDVDFYRWLQWQVAEQTAQVAGVARDRGMRFGLFQDLAVGVHPDGADTWAVGDALASGVSVGAPPDQFNQLGQDWQQPPWRPDALAARGFVPYRDMLRTVLRDAGGLRVDHVMGLFRLWWIPEGRPPSEGTYVYYDAEAMVGVLALEADRAGAIVIGEDLGVVEDGVREMLADRGILGMSIVWYEHEGDRPKPPEQYRRLCLATVSTHDLPPAAGFIGLEHVRIRAGLGILSRPVAEEAAVEQQLVDKVVAAASDRGLLGEDSEQDKVEALYEYVAQSPALLVGVSLPDLVGDHRPVNQPGTDREYPNWRVPVTDADGLQVTVEDLKNSPRAESLIARLNNR